MKTSILQLLGLGNKHSVPVSPRSIFELSMLTTVNYYGKHETRSTMKSDLSCHLILSILQ
jgi:hypothetical protein